MKNRLNYIDKKQMRKFLKGIEKKLNTSKNRKKIHWNSDNINNLFDLLLLEVEELRDSLNNSLIFEKNREAAKLESIDIAAFSFFIFDNIDKWEG